MAKPIDSSRLESLLESVQLLHSSLELDEFLKHLLRTVMGRLVVGRGFIAVNENGMQIALVRGTSALTKGQAFDETRVSAAGIDIVMPIGNCLSPVGLIGVSRPPHGEIDSEEEKFLQALLGIAASSITNALAHRQARQLNEDLNHKVQDLRALLDLGRGLTSTLEPEGVISMLALTLAGRWALRKYAVVVWKSAHPQIMRQKGMQLPNLEHLKLLSISLPEAIMVTELPESELKQELISQHAVLILPIRATFAEGVATDHTTQGGTDGIVVLGARSQKLSYQEADLEFAAGLVAQASVALQNCWNFRETVELKRLEVKLQAQKQAEMVFSALSDLLPGTVLDEKYRLESKIGSGGFGAVYCATHLELNRPVAVKVFRPMSGKVTAIGIERFRREAISACRVNHPNAVTVLDFGISKQGIVYLVMELLNGDTLADEFGRSKRLSPQRCAEIVLPLCSVLAEAHSLGIVHRDIKLDNIFLHQSPDGEVVKVVDFGLAKMFAENEDIDIKHLTIGDDILGTPAYMSPERLLAKFYDGSADIYSVGVMLYELLSGELPFVVPDKNIYMLAMMHVTMEPRPLSQLNQQIPPEIDAVVMQALQKNPKRRPTAKELATRFIEALGTIKDNCPERVEEVEENATLLLHPAARPINLSLTQQTSQVAFIDEQIQTAEMSASKFKPE